MRSGGGVGGLLRNSSCVNVSAVPTTSVTGVKESDGLVERSATVGVTQPIADTQSPKPLSAHGD